MIHVLVVDDEKLVRKGLISTMPWGEFDMEVIGEAANGEKALEFLGENHVDLMITDLAMPGMPGLELIRSVKRQYPNVFIVVLTFHRDFDYIQEALRMGAIDYILKVEMDRDNGFGVLERIAKHVTKDTFRSDTPTQVCYNPDIFVCQYAIVLICKSKEIHQSDLEELNIGVSKGTFLDECIWLVLFDDLKEYEEFWNDETKDKLREKHLIALILRQIKGVGVKLLYKAIYDYKEKGIFYDYSPKSQVIEIDSQDLFVDKKAVVEKEVKLIRERWSSLHWVMGDSVFVYMINATWEMHLPPSMLRDIFYSACEEWGKMLTVNTGDIYSKTVAFEFWYEWVQWLNEIKGFLKGQVSAPLYSIEIMKSIERAQGYISENICCELKLNEVASIANMSRSYFCQCFKDITGKTFNEYIRDIRIDMAKKLLKETDKPLYWIAEKIGYQNEKYFSIVFKEYTGYIPSEYRKHEAWNNEIDYRNG